MRYEFPHFRISRNEFAKGSNTFENWPDGGIKPSFYGYNTFSKPGFLTNPQSYGDIITSSLPVNVGISFGYGKGSLTQEVVVVGGNGSDDGSFYQMSSAGALTKVGVDDTAHDYVQGKTSTVFYKNEFYTTSTTDITKNNVALTTRDLSWWNTTQGHTTFNPFSPHPQVVYGDIHYIADGRYIHQNDNGTTQYNVFDLGVDWVITEMEVYNNLIYITAEPYYNFSGNTHGGSKMFTWNGYSDSWIDEWFLDHRINAMWVFKNTLYLWTPKFLSYWNGSTLINLYPVANKVLKHQVITTEDSMWFGDGQYLIRYGASSPTSGFRFHRYHKFVSSINGLAMPAAETVVTCTTGASNGGNYEFATTDNPDGSHLVGFNTRTFDRPVKVRGYVVHTEALASGDQLIVSYLDDQDTSYTQSTKSFNGTSMLGKKRYRFDVNGVPATTSLDMRFTLSAAVYVKAVDVLYEPSEDALNE